MLQSFCENEKRRKGEREREREREREEEEVEEEGRERFFSLVELRLICSFEEQPLHYFSFFHSFEPNLRKDLRKDFFLSKEIFLSQP